MRNPQNYASHARLHPIHVHLLPQSSLASRSGYHHRYQNWQVRMDQCGEEICVLFRSIIVYLSSIRNTSLGPDHPNSINFVYRWGKYGWSPVFQVWTQLLQRLYDISMQVPRFVNVGAYLCIKCLDTKVSASPKSEKPEFDETRLF